VLAVRREAATKIQAAIRGHQTRRRLPPRRKPGQGLTSLAAKERGLGACLGVA
jgi:hypothetical protein